MFIVFSLMIILANITDHMNGRPELRFIQELNNFECSEKVLKLQLCCAQTCIRMNDLLLTLRLS